MINPFSLEGKTILVTGASSGIGQGIAIQCSKMGAKVILNGRNEKRLKETLSQMEGDGHKLVCADLGTQEGIEKVVAECPELDGYVHSAGIPALRAVKNIDRALMQEMYNINAIAPITMTSLLVKKKVLKKKSSIVLIASTSGIFVGNVGEAPYSSTKGALYGFVKSAAIELAARGTRLNTLCPGLTPTRILEMSDNMFSKEQMIEKQLPKYPMKRFGTPEDIANGAIYLLSDASSWVTGINLNVDGGLTLE
jgi:NAD(P)-dependent dehydrogenase (short-subunit alcohol dehydrogenase family)